MMDSLSRTLLTMYEASQQCNPADFGADIFSILQKVMRFDSAGLASFSVGENGRFGMNTAYMFKQSEEKANYRKHYICDEQVGSDGILDSPDPLLRATFSTPGKALSASTVESNKNFRQYLAKFDIRNVLQICETNSKQRQADFIALWRASDRDRFDAREAQLANILLPHMSRAIAINRQISCAWIKNEPGHIGVILSSTQGCIHVANDSAMQLLQHEWSEWLPPILPAVLVDHFKTSLTREFVGKSIRAKASMNLGILMLELFAQQDSAGLTHAEWKVAQLLIEGVSYKEAARILARSPATIRNQAHGIYVKQGVSGRAALSRKMKQFIR